jgi:hypothetical protein
MKFEESNITAVFTTKFVINENKDITLVIHDKEDNTWQFYSNDHFDSYEDVAMIVGLGEIINLDDTILELVNLPEGYVARRLFKGDRWIVEKKTED